MKKLQIALPYPPSINHYYKYYRNRIVIGSAGRKYRCRIISILYELKIKPIAGNLSIEIDVYPPDKRKRDLDNVLKSLLDALQHGGAYIDDSQIKKLLIQMREPIRPRGEVYINLKSLKKQDKTK